jgi:hypothetical protein
VVRRRGVVDDELGAKYMGQIEKEKEDNRELQYVVTKEET